MGAAPELVVDGVTGFIRTDIDDMVEAVSHLGELSPEACRARVADNFTAEVMVAGYEKVFEQVIGPARS
jgi:glycosyltransferase involved in cell wall biosynthesis